MKRHFFITITALMAVMVSSCKKDNDELDNPNGPWSVELIADYTTICPDADNNEFRIELAGTGIVTIDWGDETVLENFQMPELKKYKSESEEDKEYEGTTYTHIYDKIGTYIVKVSGHGGSIVLLKVYGGSKKNGYASLVLDRCSQLQYLTCWRNNSLTSLEVSQCPQLKGLFLESGYLTSLDLSKCTKLEELYLVYTPMPTIDVSRCTQLKDLYVNGSRLISLDVSKCTQLKELGCNGNLLVSLDVSKCTKLKYLDCGTNQLTTLDVSKCTQLEELDCAGNQLTSLDVSGCSQLEELRCYKNQLTSLDVSGCAQLEILNCRNNRLSVAAMNKIYNDLPIVGQGMGVIYVDKATAGDYYIAENKGWFVDLW